MNAKAAQSVAPEESTAPEVIRPVSAIVEYTQTEAALADMRERLKSVVFDVTTTAGDKAARTARKECVTLRTALEEKRLELNAKDQERIKGRNAEAKRIAAEIEALEGPIDSQIKAQEQRKEEERKAREAAERARIAAIQERIDWIREQAAEAVGQPSAVIQERIETLVAYPIDGTFAELEKQAEGARATTLIRLRAAHAKALEIEAEQARLAAEREELARLKKAEEARQAAERARLAEEERLHLEALATQRKQQAEEDRKARQTLEAERKVQAETLRRQQEAQAAETARLRREQEAAAAVERERIAAEEAALQERIEAQRAKEEERIRQQELEDAARAAETARLAQAQADFEEAREAFKAAQERPAATELIVDETAGATLLPNGDLVLQGPLPSISWDSTGPKSTDADQIVEPFRPTDEAIVHLVMTTYSVSVPTAIQWLQEMDFETVGV